MVEVGWSDLGLKGSQPVRDLWQHRDLGSSDSGFSGRIGGHGAVMIRVGKPLPVRFPLYGSETAAP